MNSYFRVIFIPLFFVGILGFANAADEDAQFKQAEQDLALLPEIGNLSVIDDLIENDDKAKQELGVLQNLSSVQRASHLDNVRQFRVHIARKLPQVRTILDALRQLRIRKDQELHPGPDKSRELTFAKEGVAIRMRVAQANIDRATDELAKALDKDKPGIETYIDQNKLELEKAQADNEDIQNKIAEQIKISKISVDQANKILTAIDILINRFQITSSEADDILSSLDDVSSEMLNTASFQNYYTNWATIAFSILVGIVILGFFFIALKHGVAAQIFTGQGGIQFVTLFSLIIAIILFGVLKILEGKELAALLGGLSGYILGRGASTSNSPGVPNTPNPSGAPGSGSEPGANPVAGQRIDQTVDRRSHPP